MKNGVLPEKFRDEYQLRLSRLFYSRVNLFCYIAISTFLLEIILSFSFFSNVVDTKDIPGVAGGMFFSALLLATGKLSDSLYFQKLRAFFFSFLLILIAILAAQARPDVMPYMGSALILLAFLSSVLLLPWTWLEAAVIGTFTVVNFIWIYRVMGTFVNIDVFAINIVLLGDAAFIGAIVKRSEEVLKIKNFIILKHIEEKNAMVAKELELAKRIHKGLMPRSVSTDIADIAVTHKPMFYMGGDYANVHFMDDKKLFFILADVTGHGVSAALLVNRLHIEVEQLISEDMTPGNILNTLERFVNEDFGKMGFFLSAFCGILDFARNKLVYSNYGHPPQILLHLETNKIELMRPQTFLMGAGMGGANRLYSTEVTFKRGDRLILFSDGIVEAKNSNEKFFGYKRLEMSAKNNIGLKAEEFNRKLVSEVREFQSGRQADDIFLLTIQTK